MRSHAGRYAQPAENCVFRVLISSAWRLLLLTKSSRLPASPCSKDGTLSWSMMVMFVLLNWLSEARSFSTVCCWMIEPLRPTFESVML